MYYSHKFTDPEVKAEGVLHNTIDMMFSYFWTTMQLEPRFTGMTLEEISVTKAIIRQWLDDTFTNMEQVTAVKISDFITRLVHDYKENYPTEGEWNE